MTRDKFNEAMDVIDRSNSVANRTIKKYWNLKIDEKNECSNYHITDSGIRYYDTEKRQLARDLPPTMQLDVHLVHESIFSMDLRPISPSVQKKRNGSLYLFNKYIMGDTTIRIAEREGCDRKTIQRGISEAKDFLYTTQWEYDQFISKENISKVAIMKVEHVQYFISRTHWFEREPGTDNIKKDRRRTIHIPSDFEIIKSHMDLLLEIVQTYGYVLFDTEVIPDVFTELLNINDDAELRTIFEDRDKFTAILEGMARELTTDKEGR